MKCLHKILLIKSFWFSSHVYNYDDLFVLYKKRVRIGDYSQNWNRIFSDTLSKQRKVFMHDTRSSDNGKYNLKGKWLNLIKDLKKCGRHLEFSS